MTIRYGISKLFSGYDALRRCPFLLCNIYLFLYNSIIHTNTCNWIDMSVEFLYSRLWNCNKQKQIAILFCVLLFLFILIVCCVIYLDWRKSCINSYVLYSRCICMYPLIGARVPAYMRVNGRIWCTNYRWLCYGQY
jgi:hypothetical protein